MANGDCPIGAAHTADIKALQREQKTQNEAIRTVNVKLDKINWWLVATLGGVVVNLLLQVAGRM